MGNEYIEIYRKKGLAGLIEFTDYDHMGDIPPDVCGWGNWRDSERLFMAALTKEHFDFRPKTSGFDVEVIFRNRNLAPMREWCDDNSIAAFGFMLADDPDLLKLTFEDESDAVLFKIKWAAVV